MIAIGKLFLFLLVVDNLSRIICLDPFSCFPFLCHLSLMRNLLVADVFPFPRRFLCSCLGFGVLFILFPLFVSFVLDEEVFGGRCISLSWTFSLPMLGFWRPIFDRKTLDVISLLSLIGEVSCSLKSRNVRFEPLYFQMLLLQVFLL